MSPGPGFSALTPTVQFRPLQCPPPREEVALLTETLRVHGRLAAEAGILPVLLDASCPPMLGELVARLMRDVATLGGDLVSCGS